MVSLNAGLLIMTMKYLLRSTELYAPWINKIFIVTDGQIPKWLNIEHPKIRIVDHKEIIPAGRPCRLLIEAYLPLIPGLSERFLYANDDMMFNAPVSKEFFYNEDGYPIFRIKYKLPDPPGGTHQKTIDRAVDLVMNKYRIHLEKRFPHHNIDAYLKSTFLSCKKEFKNEYKACMKNRFRTENGYSRFLVSYYGIAIGKAIPRIATPSESLTLLPNEKIAKLSLLNGRLSCFVLTVTKKQQIQKGKMQNCFWKNVSQINLALKSREKDLHSLFLLDIFLKYDFNISLNYL